MPKLDLSFPNIIQTFGAHVMKGRRLERSFLGWFLENYYRLDETEVYDSICDGEFDKGIDGIYVNEELGQIDVFQTTLPRSQTDHGKPKDQGDRKLRDFAGVLSSWFKDEASVKYLLASTRNPDLARILQDNDVAQKVKEGYEVRGFFITTRKRDQEAIDILKVTPNLTLYDEEELQQAYIHPTRSGPIEKEITFTTKGMNVLPYSIGAELEMIIAPLAASELIEMEGIANGELFAWNVRQWLGKKTKVNKDVEKSITKQNDDDDEYPEHRYFPAFHNGLTILCKTLKGDPAGSSTPNTITISGYAVINGCQSLTTLHAHKKHITPELRFLTKFIKIAPDSDLALKITDHANNQNGITGRDLKSNNPIQRRLQAEINNKYGGDIYYRVKRGENPACDSQNVIENDLAARILLAFDLRQPWVCHQTYKLFNELHNRIFGRREVTADRIIVLWDVFRLAEAKLRTIENELFGGYGLTRFFLMYLVREALETSIIGKEFCGNPAEFLQQADGRQRIGYALGNVVDTIGDILDTEVTRRNEVEPGEADLFGNVKDDDQTKPFEYKRELKNPNPVRTIKSQVISHYMFLVKHHKQGFEQWWKDSERYVAQLDGGGI